MFFGNPEELKVGGRLSYLKQIMAVDNLVNAKEDQITSWAYNNDPECKRARSLDEKTSYLILYTMENNKPFIFPIPEGDEDRSEAIYQWINVSMTEFRITWSFRSLNAINVMNGHLLTYSPSEKRIKHLLSKVQIGEHFNDKSIDIVYNVVTWIRE